MRIKNWRTTLAGLIGGLALIIKGFLTKDPVVITEGVGVVVIGIAAADSADTDQK